MEGKVLIIITVLVLVGVVHQVAADKYRLMYPFMSLSLKAKQILDFYYNHVDPKSGELAEKHLKCIPGRTLIKVAHNPAPPEKEEDEEFSSDEDARRSHMNHRPDVGETCKICVCSTEGKDEYCSTRPAKNVNECIRMNTIMDDFKKNIPYDHERFLSNVIRRDYVWHKDEIPYEAKAKCKRGFSYYSNSIFANDTDIDLPSELDSLLDYSNKDVCFYCVCSVHGGSVGCLARDSWFCDYYRKLREPSQPRDMYREMFEQDRPAYFRFLSHRLRRTMDNGIFELIDSVGGDSETKCVPFVSQYTDCTEANLCSGCTKCGCGLDGQWSCDEVKECRDDSVQINDKIIENALEVIKKELKYSHNKPTSSNSGHQKKGSSNLLLDGNNDDKLSDLLRRKKRSSNNENAHNTVKFHHTVDEINEDTLKNSNISGTLGAPKIDVSPKSSRRSGTDSNITDTNPLQIQYKNQNIQDNHIADNKIDETHQVDEYDSLVEKKLHKIIGNQTNQIKTKNISKLVVNELKNTTEFIGDKNAPIISNITFTPENDTLTAMALIAGNLLNKLWELEKDSTDSLEIELVKHEKIADLIELFKEPHTLQQENFIRNALEKISEAVDKKESIKNFSLCENAKQIKDLITEESKQIPNNIYDNRKNFNDDSNSSTKQSIKKMRNVLDLIKKFENVQINITNLELKKLFDTNIEREKKLTSQDLFINMLATITKLLLPNDKKTIKRIKTYASRNDETKALISRMFNVNLENTTLNSKDKLLLSYLNKVGSKNDCTLGCSHSHTKSLQDVGDVLLNLSEFFKIKSFVELMKIEEPEKKQFLRTGIEPKTIPLKSNLVTSKPIAEISTNTNEDDKNTSTKLTSTKEKLKAHLKAIINDLVQIQKERGINTKKNINIADALPCIYNIFNSNPYKNIKSDPVEKITKVFNSIKEDLKVKTRRSDFLNEKPTSAYIWERVLKILGNKHMEASRRKFDVKIPKSYEEIKKEIDQIDLSQSDTYKSSSFDKVPATEQLMLLKTLELNNKQYTNVLLDIKASFDNVEKLPIEKINDLFSFVTNAEMNMNLNEKIIKQFNKHQSKVTSIPNLPKVDIIDKSFQTNSMDVRYISPTKITRDQILNYLIKHKIEIYLKIKKGTGNNNDINLNIAKKILVYLNQGNSELARELYKAFLINQENRDNLKGEIDQRVPNVYPTPFYTAARHTMVEEKLTKNEQLYKQLLNIKNMSFQ